MIPSQPVNMGNTQSSLSLHPLDSLQKHIFQMIYSYFRPPSQMPVKDFMLQALDIAFLVRSVCGNGVEPSRVKLVNRVKPKVEQPNSFIAPLVDKVCGPIQTLALAIGDSRTVGNVSIVEVEHRSHRITSATMMALLEKVQEQIKVILEKEAKINKAAELAQQAKTKEIEELIKKYMRVQMAQEKKAMLVAHTIPSTMPGPMPGAFLDTSPKRLGEPCMVLDEAYMELGYLVVIKACEAGKDFLERVRSWAAKKNDSIAENVQEVDLKKNASGQTNAPVSEAVYQEGVNVLEKKDIQKVELMKKNANKDLKEIDTIARNIIDAQEKKEIQKFDLKKTNAQKDTKELDVIARKMFNIQKDIVAQEDDTSCIDSDFSEASIESSLVIV
jgi:hypothetical protein